MSQEIEVLIEEATRDICAQPFGVKSAVSRRLRSLALEVASSVRRADAEIARTLAFKCDREANATMAASEGTAEGAAMELAAMAVAANRIAAAIEEASK